jgi:hypothetical protein
VKHIIGSLIITVGVWIKDYDIRCIGLKSIRCMWFKSK